jgi:SAM-dependent methyltransferase
MQLQGYDVLATDVSEIALEYCRRKGLKTLRYEFPTQVFPMHSKFDVIYCDGLLGHLWELDQTYASCWRRLAELADADALLILSNDLADTDGAPVLKVMGVPGATFFRPPAGWFAKAAEASKFWRVEETRLLRYLRRGLPRRREILALRYSLMNEGKEKHNLVKLERSDVRFVE